MKKIFIAAIMLLLGTKALAQNDYKVQAGFLYHFTKHIEWSVAKQNTDLVIGVMGDASVIRAMEEMVQARNGSNTQKMVVRKINPTTDLSTCHIVYVQNGYIEQFNEASAKTNLTTVLIVSESATPAQKNICINFMLKEDKLRFTVNKAAIERAGLKISTDLVKLSIHVETAP